MESFLLKALVKVVQDSCTKLDDPLICRTLTGLKKLGNFFSKVCKTCLWECDLIFLLVNCLQQPDQVWVIWSEGLSENINIITS